jgi:hypothetical protein
LKSIFKRITKLTEVRNQLTHRDIWDVPFDELLKFKEDVSDILYMLDYLNGAKWAINNIRKETCQALKWPNPIST